MLQLPVLLSLLTNVSIWYYLQFFYLAWLGCLDEPLPQASERCSEMQCPYLQLCIISSDGLPTCVCDFNCSATPSPAPAPSSASVVCGSNGQTYESECQLKLTACRLQTPITVASQGNCNKGNNLFKSFTPVPVSLQKTSPGILAYWWGSGIQVTCRQEWNEWIFKITIIY